MQRLRDFGGSNVAQTHDAVGIEAAHVKHETFESGCVAVCVRSLLVAVPDDQRDPRERRLRGCLRVRRFGRQCGAQQARCAPQRLPSTYIPPRRHIAAHIECLPDSG